MISFALISWAVGTTKKRVTTTIIALRRKNRVTTKEIALRRTKSRYDEISRVTTKKSRYDKEIADDERNRVTVPRPTCMQTIYIPRRSVHCPTQPHKYLGGQRIAQLSHAMHTYQHADLGLTWADLGLTWADLGLTWADLELTWASWGLTWG